MDKSSRGIRRHHLKRLKGVRRHDLRFLFSSQSPDARELGKHVTTPAACSCWLCGNPRHHFSHITLKERRNDAGLDEIAQAFISNEYRQPSRVS